MNLVYEYNAGSTGTAYHYGINRTHSSSGSYYLYNGHGDVVQLMSSAGAVTKSYAYDAFGNEKNPSSSDTNPFRYCGEYFDTESGTIYLRARYYNPANGRFTQQDSWGYVNPGDPLSLNLYVYCYANPVRYIDPSGLSGIQTDGTYYITHPLDKELLELKQEYVYATPERQVQIAIEAQNIRNTGKEGIDWSVRADRTLNYYMIDTDVTKKLNAVIKSSESENFWKYFCKMNIVTNVVRYIDFAFMVRPGGKYDLKSKTEWQGKEHFIYDGEIIWYDEPGNILYGHLGKVMGFEDVILKSAGGAVQIATRTSSWRYILSYFDDPRDQKAIQKGIDIFKNTHSWIMW